MGAFNGRLRDLLGGTLGRVTSEVLTFTDYFTWSGNHTYSGTVTHTGTLTLTGATVTLPTQTRTRGIPISDFRGATGLILTATETAGGFNVKLSSNVWQLQGEVTDNETEVSVCNLNLIVPSDYVAGTDLTLTLPAALVKSGSPTDNGSTLDVEVYRSGRDGTVGSDIQATAAVTFAALDTYYNKAFTITGTTLAAGDALTVKVTSSVVDSEAGGGTIIMTIDPPSLSYTARS